MHHVQTPLAETNGAAQQLRLPDFFIVGSAKCGTTTLYKYLCRHPKVFMSTPKEMSYFSKDDVFERGIQWYADLFADASDDQLCGEASTTYTRWPLYDKTVERLYAAQPEARLIYLVRDPVERLFSFYAHRMREKVTTTFEDFLRRTPEAIDSGRYMTQIKQYLRVFQEQQMLVLFTKDLRDTPEQTLSKVGDFLSLPEYDFLQAGPIRANQGGGKYYAAASLTQAIRTVKRTPALGSLVKVVPGPLRKSGYEWLANGPVGKRLRRRHQNNMCVVTPKMRQQIFDLYREEIEELEAFTGRSLPDWKGESA